MTEKKDLKIDKVIGIDITITPVDEVLGFIAKRLQELDKNNKKNGKIFIVTPNPEIVLQARDDKKLKKILNKADIAVPDGVGLVTAHKFLNLPDTKNVIKKPILYFAQGLGVGFSVLFNRDWLEKEMKVIRGRELFVDLVKLADEKKWRVFFVGGWDKVAERTKIELEKEFKNIKIKAATGPVLKNDGTALNKREKDIDKRIVKEINEFRPHMLFVGFGAPKQEKWVDKWIDDLEIGGAMVVGSTFNVISGKAKTPPEWVSDAGLEWLFRLITGSQTKERVLNAFPKFAWEVFKEKWFVE